MQNAFQVSITSAYNHCHIETGQAVLGIRRRDMTYLWGKTVTPKVSQTRV